MLDLNALSDAIEKHGKVARVVLAEVKGSAPREAGTSMLIWADGYSGTIGGGRLEFDAIHTAQAMLDGGPITALHRKALGPALNQCCGGAVTVVTEVYDITRYHAMMDGFEFQGIWARAVSDEVGALPKSIARLIARKEQDNTPISTTFSAGWLIEPVWRNRQPVYIYGAGHVGRALARVLSPLPQYEVWLVDVRADQFMDIPENVHECWHVPPTEIMAAAPPNAAHFIMTPEHDFDLELCHTLLGREFAFGGLIGSATKWARFRKRLAALGHEPEQVARITCPIGDPTLGKNPQAIALGIAAKLLKTKNSATAQHMGKKEQSA